MKKYLILCGCLGLFFVTACSKHESCHPGAQQIDAEKVKEKRFAKDEVMTGKVLLILNAGADVEVVKNEVAGLGGEVLIFIAKQSVVVVKVASSSQGELAKYQSINGVKSAEWNQKRGVNQ